MSSLWAQRVVKVLQKNWHTLQGTCSALLGLSLVATFIRFYIRFRIQRKFGWDDAFLIFGLLCIISCIGLLFAFKDDIYETEYLVYAGGSDIVISDLPVLLKRCVRFRQISAANATLSWISICSVKFSFLAFFKRMIHQMPPMLKYWWCVLVFNIIATVYGSAVYLGAACPYFSEKDIFKIREEPARCKPDVDLTKTLECNAFEEMGWPQPWGMQDPT